MQKIIFRGVLYLERVSNTRCLGVSQVIINLSVPCTPTNTTRGAATSSHGVWETNCVKQLHLSAPVRSNIMTVLALKLFPFLLALVRATLKSMHKQKAVCSVVSHLYWQPSCSVDHQVHRWLQNKSGFRLRNTKMTRIPVRAMMKFNKDECRAPDSHLEASCPRTCGLAGAHVLKPHSLFFFLTLSLQVYRVMWLPGNVLSLATPLMNRSEAAQVKMVVHLLQGEPKPLEELH